LFSSDPLASEFAAFDFATKTARFYRSIRIGETRSNIETQRRIWADDRKI